jgi:hypothetical protein
VRYIFLLSLLILLMSLVGCATIDARFQLADGRWAEVKARRLFVSVDVVVVDGKNDIRIQYGAQSEADKLQQLLTTLGPLLAAARTVSGVPIP